MTGWWVGFIYRVEQGLLAGKTVNAEAEGSVGSWNILSVLWVSCLSASTNLLLFKDFPTQVSAKFRRLLFEIDLGFLGTRAEIVKYTQLVSGRESWEVLFPSASARSGHRRWKKGLETRWENSWEERTSERWFHLCLLFPLVFRLSGSSGSKAMSHVDIDCCHTLIWFKLNWFVRKGSSSPCLIETWPTPKGTFIDYTKRLFSTEA